MSLTLTLSIITHISLYFCFTLLYFKGFVLFWLIGKEISTSTRLLYTSALRPPGCIPRFSPSFSPIPHSAVSWPHMFWRGPQARPGLQKERGSAWCHRSPAPTRLHRWSHTSHRWSPLDLPTAASRRTQKSHRTPHRRNAPERRSGTHSAILHESGGQKKRQLRIQSLTFCNPEKKNNAIFVNIM